MTISTKQTAQFITAKQSRPNNHHRSYRESAKMHNANPFAQEGHQGKSKSTQNEPISQEKREPAKTMSDTGNVRSEKAIHG